MANNQTALRGPLRLQLPNSTLKLTSGLLGGPHEPQTFLARGSSARARRSLQSGWCGSRRLRLTHIVGLHIHPGPSTLLLHPRMRSGCVCRSLSSYRRCGSRALLPVSREPTRLRMFLRRIRLRSQPLRHERRVQRRSKLPTVRPIREVRIVVALGNGAHRHDPNAALHVTPL